MLNQKLRRAAPARSLGKVRKSIAKTPFDPKTAVALAGTGRSGSSGAGQDRTHDRPLLGLSDRQHDVSLGRPQGTGAGCRVSRRRMSAGKSVRPEPCGACKTLSGQVGCVHCGQLQCPGHARADSRTGQGQRTHLPRFEGRRQCRGRRVRSRTNSGSLRARCPANRALPRHARRSIRLSRAAGPDRRRPTSPMPSTRS